MQFCSILPTHLPFDGWIGRLACCYLLVAEVCGYHSGGPYYIQVNGPMAVYTSPADRYRVVQGKKRTAILFSKLCSLSRSLTLAVVIQEGSG